MYIKSMEQMWLEPREVVNCIIEPGLLPTGGLMVITGEPGVGKSWLAQQIGFEIACGYRVLGLFGTKRNKVVYFELEMRSPIARERFRGNRWADKYPGAAQMMGHYDDTVISMESKIHTGYFQEALEEFGAKVAIIDSYSVTLDDEIDLKRQKTTIANYRSVAKELKMGIIMIQHLVKRGQVYDNKTKEWSQPPLALDDIRGSKFLQHEVDSALGLTQARIKGVRELGFLKHRFTPVELSSEPSISLRWNPSSGSPLWPLEFRLAAIMKILDEEEFITVAELEKVLTRHDDQTSKGVSRPTVLKAIERLRDLGLIQVIEGGGKGNETWVHI